MRKDSHDAPLPAHAAFERLVLVHLDAGYNLARWLLRDETEVLT